MAIVEEGFDPPSQMLFSEAPSKIWRWPSFLTIVVGISQNLEEAQRWSGNIPVA
jgi:hypothetical protein